METLARGERSRPPEARPAPPDKSPKAIREMFSSISGRYDLLNGLLSGGLDRAWRRRAVSAAGSDPRARVLDLGTGTGDLALAFLRKADERGRVVGVDFARPMLERARAKAGRAGELRLVQADAVSLPFRDASFDVVSAAFVARNIANLPEALAACHRVLRPRGLLVLLEFFRADRLSWPLRAYVNAVVPRLGAAVSGHASAYAYLRDSQESFLSIEEALALFAKAGFGALRVERLFPGVAVLLVLERS